MRSHIGTRGEQNIPFKDVETSLQYTRFKNLERKSKGKTQKGQYLLAVSLSYYKWYQSQTLDGVPMKTLGTSWALKGTGL